MNSYMSSHGFSWSLGLFSKNHLLEVGHNTKPGDHGTPVAHNRSFILYSHVWGPAWIEIHWNSIKLRVCSHMTSHYPWGLVTALYDLGGVMGRPLDTFFWALTISWSWLLARVWSGPKEPPRGFIFVKHGSYVSSLIIWEFIVVLSIRSLACGRVYGPRACYVCHHHRLHNLEFRGLFVRLSSPWLYFCGLWLWCWLVVMVIILVCVVVWVVFIFWKKWKKKAMVFILGVFFYLSGLVKKTQLDISDVWCFKADPLICVQISSICMHTDVYKGWCNICWLEMLQNAWNVQYVHVDPLIHLQTKLNLEACRYSTAR